MDTKWREISREFHVRRKPIFVHSLYTLSMLLRQSVMWAPGRIGSLAERLPLLGCHHSLLKKTHSRVLSWPENLWAGGHSRAQGLFVPSTKCSQTQFSFVNCEMWGTWAGTGWQHPPRGGTGAVGRPWHFLPRSPAQGCTVWPLPWAAQGWHTEATEPPHFPLAWSRGRGGSSPRSCRRLSTCWPASSARLILVYVSTAKSWPSAWLIYTLYPARGFHTEVLAKFCF